MREFWEHVDVAAILSSLLAFLTGLISYYIFLKKRRADENLASLLEADTAFRKSYTSEVEKIKNFNKQSMHDLGRHKLRNDLDLKMLEIRKELAEKELELLKMDIYRKHIIALTEKLDEKEKEQVLDALNQRTTRGRISYINSILRLSGSSDTIRYKLEE